MRFVVEIMAHFYSVSTIPAVLQLYIQLHVALNRRQTGYTWEPSKKQSLSNTGEHWIEMHFHLFMVKVSNIIDQYYKQQRNSLEL